MSNVSGLFMQLDMTRIEFEKIADQHKLLIGSDPRFNSSDGYVMSEVELEVFCSLFKTANKPQQILLASMLCFIQKELRKETV